jgi:ribonuclease D
LDKAPQSKHIYVDTDEAMKSLLEHMDQSGSIALDTEADSLYHYYHKVCLIQLTFDDQNYILDPLSKIDFKPFLKLLVHKPMILHDAGYDLRMMQSTFGFIPRGEVFDTMLAAQLLGHTKFGLGSLVEQYFGIVMPKGGQKSDWSRRPLTDKQLEYASEDTFYLHKLADIFAADLEKLDRTSWHEEWCVKTLYTAENYKPSTDPAEAWRIKGARYLEKVALTQLQQIWKWRDRQSQMQDVPAFKVMGNSLLMKLAVWTSTNPHNPLSSGPKLPGNCRGRRLEELRKAIAIAHNIPESEMPTHPKPKHHPKPAPETNIIFEKLKVECDQIAEEINVATQVISPRATLKTIAIKQPKSFKEITKCGAIMKWQAKLLEPAINKILKAL